jgi:four helix bundle protein
VTRSGLSIPSNIAEGFERDSEPEKVKFLVYAKGSCGELRTQVQIGMEAGFVDRETGRRWVNETREIGAMLGGLIKKLRGASG